jgi:arsenate reductase
MKMGSPWLLKPTVPCVIIALSKRNVPERWTRPVNIQIFGTGKCFDTKKAERYFKERGIKYQFIDMKEKGLSKGEYNGVRQAVGGLDAMLDENCKDQAALALIKYIAGEDKDEKVLENQKVLKTPIVRNGKLATVGYRPEVWKNWS